MARRSKDSEKSKRSQSRPLNSNRKSRDSSSTDDKHYAKNRRQDSSTCLKCLRGTMSFYNVILLLVGLGGLGAGVWLMLKDFNAREVTALIGVNMFEIASYLLIAGGGIVSLLAFCGCCGTMKEDRCVLGFYATTLTLMLFMLIGGSVVAFISKEYLADKLQQKFIRTIAIKYGVDVRTNTDNRLVTDAWDSVQREMECCGVRGNVSSEQSWALYKSESQWYAQKTKKTPYVPESCCKKDADIGLCTGTKSFNGPPHFTLTVAGRKINPHLSSDGCYEKIVEKIGEHSLIIGLVSASIPLFLIAGVVISCCLCFKVEKDPDDDDDSDYFGPQDV